MKLYMKEPNVNDFATRKEYFDAYDEYSRWKSSVDDILFEAKIILNIILIIVAISVVIWVLCYSAEVYSCRVNSQLNPNLHWQTNYWKGCLFQEPKTGVWFEDSQLNLILGLIK